MLGRRPLVRGVARTAVVAGTATAVSGRVRRRQNNKWARRSRPSTNSRRPRSRAPAAPAASSETDELKQIADLHTQGILTDEEFAAKKAQILGI